MLHLAPFPPSLINLHMQVLIPSCNNRVELCPGDYVTISASRYPFANVMQQGRRSEDWVNSISRTLNWNSRQRQKSFKEWSVDENDRGRKGES